MVDTQILSEDFPMVHTAVPELDHLEPHGETWMRFFVSRLDPKFSRQLSTAKWFRVHSVEKRGTMQITAGTEMFLETVEGLIGLDALQQETINNLYMPIHCGV